MKNILLSKTFWVQIVALLVLVFPAVKSWFDSNPVEYLTALAAVNVLLRFVTRGAVSILPGATAGAEPSECDDETGNSGGLLAWLPPAALAGLVGFSSPGCSPVPAGSLPFAGTVLVDGATLHYDSKAGLAVTVDQRSAK